jgi:flagellar basal body rod protein FlgG
MIKGLYSAVSAMIMNQNRQEALTHNVSNLSTTGFKEILTTAQEYIKTDAKDPMDTFTTGEEARSVGTLGLGVENGPSLTDFTQGTLQNTDKSTDLAIEGTAFFHVKTPEGDRYTRDGRFIVDAKGNLTTVDGYQVLDNKGTAIKVDTEDFSVSSSGVVTVDGKEVATIGLVEFTDPAKNLTRVGDGNLFSASGTGTAAKNSSIKQSALESSNVDTTKLVSSMIQITRYFEAAQTLIQNQDELLGKSISTLGNV